LIHKFDSIFDNGQESIKSQIQNSLETFQTEQENLQPEDGQGSQETEQTIKTKTKEIQIAGVTAMLTTFGEILKDELKF
jgi:hypothetical protein